MGKPTGFLEYERVENTVADPSVRIRDFKEFRKMLPEAERIEQAARCMNCGVPFCQSALELKGRVTGCPLHNLIPEWNDEIYRGHDRFGLERLLQTNPFPEFTGRVCPALCEKACINGMQGESVTVHENELWLIEHAFAEGWIRPVPPVRRSGKSVAVIGSGPAGLACANALNRRGHSVTVYERDDAIGGLLMYGIPNMKIDKSVLRRRQELMEAEDVRFVTGVAVGRDIGAEELMQNYDAIALCTGAREARKLSAEGTDAVKEGIWYAVDFLKEVTKEVLAEQDGTEQGGTDPEVAQSGPCGMRDLVSGRQVVILGGGDTGNDCIGSVIRLGAASVRELEMMPEPPEKRRENNPWPEWPDVKKTDYGVEEAIWVFGKDPRQYETTVKAVHGDDAGKLTAVTMVRVSIQNGKITEVPGTEETVPCDLLIIAAGFTGCEKELPEQFGVALTGRGRTATEAGSMQTSVPGIFTAGDMHRGPSLVVWAIAEGKACAREIDAYLMGYTEMI